MGNTEDIHALLQVVHAKANNEDLEDLQASLADKVKRQEFHELVVGKVNNEDFQALRASVADKIDRQSFREMVDDNVNSEVFHKLQASVADNVSRQDLRELVDAEVNNEDTQALQPLPPPRGTLRRINKELQDIGFNPPLNCPCIGSIGDDLSNWVGTILSPSGTPYQDGVFFLNISFPRNYPFKPPDVRFTTKIYRCNVSRNGRLSMDILQDQWSPALTISKVLLSIYSMLLNPNPHYPLEPEIAHDYLKDRAKHDRTAAEWVQMYAI